MHDRGFAEVSLIPSSGCVRRSGQFPCSAGVAQLVEHLFCKQAVGGSSPFASSKFSFITKSDFSVGCPSGQREQAVNLPDYSYVGSNPTPTTEPFVAFVGRLGCVGDGPRFGLGLCFAAAGYLNCRAGLASHRRSGRRPRRGTSVAVSGVDRDLVFQDPRLVAACGAPTPPAGFRTGNAGSAGTTPSEGTNPSAGTSRSTGRTSSHRAFVSLGFTNSAGVAQLVERQPSKLNVEGSSPFSRSTVRGAFSRSPFLARRARGVAKCSRRARAGARIQAHIAQMVERVLGKDEVTSSILVVGSNRNANAVS
jgi:hypothetical protein